MERALSQGPGQAQQLAVEMERLKVSVLAVTETHLPGSGEMALDESKGYRMVFSGRQDGSTINKSRSFVGGCGVYPSDQSSTEDKDNSTQTWMVS